MRRHKVLITGAAGFIGSQLFVRLRDAGYDVTGIDNFCDHLYDPELKYNRNTELGLNCFLVDICYISHIREAMNEIKPDTVIHLAALAGVRDSFGKEQDYHRVNIEGTQNLIDVCKEMEDPPNIIYASTSSVYGDTKTFPWTEDRVDGHQLNAYAYTKYVNECQMKCSGLHTVGLRFFTVYGPWGRPDMALFSFTDDIVNDREITVYNNGEMKRDFTYIDDIVDGIMIVLNSNVESGEIFNIGRGEPINLMDFVREIETNVGKLAEIKMAPKHPADALDTWSDTTKLQQLGYKPKVSIVEGIRRFYEWYEEYNS